MITIYQIQISNAQVDAFNAGDQILSLDAKRRLMFGAEEFKDEMVEYFTPVYEIEVDDLDDAFEITNLWNNPHVVKAISGTRGHSSSVGDIFVRGNEAYMVDTFGFTKLENIQLGA